MTIKAPVQPGYGTGQTLAPAAGAATANLTAGSKQLILTNLGANPAYVRVAAADSISAATVADYPIPAGAQVVISKADQDNRLSHISPLGTTLHVMNGEGF
ncbi:hypothetical protein [Massilia sp. ZL223]|uniref:hypothetical protein n=1 Tax=Massilia sp. ZL223 TaxID=2824904 RepID=UPI001B8101BC|nr:hypothetical protein [Massilia sp. ZL223]MBQ5963146.1 hypothetical protein [Massilia sp. ZL223]